MKYELFKNIYTVVRWISVYALDTIAPPDPVVRSIELMNMEQFLSLVEKSETGGAILKYKDVLVKTAVLEVKSYGNKRLALLLGSVLYTHLCAERAHTSGTPPTQLSTHTGQHPLLIPIPITKKSLRARGWNQCELICRGLEKVDTDQHFEIRTDILYKIRETADQVGKGRAERFKNLEQSFAVIYPEKVRGRDVIIFDDILTTGATLGEAVRAMHAAGAGRVTCIALAH